MQIEESLKSINEQLRDAKDDRRMTKHQEKMAEALQVVFFFFNFLDSRSVLSITCMCM